MSAIERLWPGSESRIRFERDEARAKLRAAEDEANRESARAEDLSEQLRRARDQLTRVDRALADSAARAAAARASAAVHEAQARQLEAQVTRLSGQLTVANATIEQQRAGAGDLGEYRRRVTELRIDNDRLFRELQAAQAGRVSVPDADRSAAHWRAKYEQEHATARRLDDLLARERGAPTQLPETGRP